MNEMSQKPSPKWEKRKCDNCKQREATSRWGGDSNGVDVFRRMHSLPWWCEICMKEAQLEYLRSLDGRIPKIEKELEELYAKEKEEQGLA